MSRSGRGYRPLNPSNASFSLTYWDRLYTPFQSEPNAAPVRLIVRRVKPTPGSQLALFANYRYHGCITDRDGDTLDLEADHRRHAEIENAIRDLKYGVGLNHLPSGRFPANPEPAEGGLAGRTGHRPQPGSLDSAHRSGRATGDHQDPAATLLLPGRTAHPLSAPTHPAPATTLALGKPVQSCPGKIPRPPAPSLTAATSPPTRHPPHGTAPPTRTNPVREGHSLHTAFRITPDMTTAGHQNRAGVATSRRPHPHLWNQTCPARLPLPIIPGFNPSDHRFGGFGLRYRVKMTARVVNGPEGTPTYRWQRLLNRGWVTRQVTGDSMTVRFSSPGTRTYRVIAIYPGEPEITSNPFSLTW